MRSFIATYGLLVWGSILTASLGCERNEQIQENKLTVMESYGKVPLTFVENRGQVNHRVRFLVRGHRGTVFFTDDAVVFDVAEHITGEDADSLPRRRGVVVRMNFEGTNPSPLVEGRKELPGKVNVFRGKDQSTWRTGIPTYREIVYRDLWSGVDLFYKGDGSRLSYELQVKPHGRVEDICFRYEGVEDAKVNEEGSLLLETSLGTIVEMRPILHQKDDGKRIEVAGRYHVSNGHTVRFETGPYDRKRTLVISQGP